MPSHFHIRGRQRVLSHAGVKCAFDMVDVRDVERTPVWMHAHNALIDKLLGETPENPLYHPGFATMDERTLFSMIPEREQKTLMEFYPQAGQFMAPANPPPPPLQLPPEPKVARMLAPANALLGAMGGAIAGGSVGHMASENPTLMQQLTGRDDDIMLRNVGGGAAGGALAGGLVGGLGGRHGANAMEILGEAAHLIDLFG